MKQAWQRVLVGSSLMAGAVMAGPVTVRLVDAGAPDTPVCERVDFRASPYGGLVATQWVSSVRIDGMAPFEPELLPAIREHMPPDVRGRARWVWKSA